MKNVIRNCRIVSPGIDIPCGSITIENGVITAVTPGKSPVSSSDIDGASLIACPGFIDIHSHGRSNFDFCDGTPEAIKTIGRDKLVDGVTGFLATGLSVAVEDLTKLCEQAEWYKVNVY